jgi:hypothetical protein
MVSPSKMLTLGRADASIALLSLNRIFDSIRFFCDQLHRVADIPPSDLISDAKLLKFSKRNKLSADMF